MSNQLTILNPDNSFVEAFFIGHSLHQELTRIKRIFELNCLSLAFLHEIKTRALSFCSHKLENAKPLAVLSFASISLDWFDELLVLIDAIEKLPLPHSLSISFT